MYMLSADVTFEVRLAEAIDEEFTDTKSQLDLRGHAWPWPHIPYLPHSHTRGSLLPSLWGQLCTCASLSSYGRIVAHGSTVI